jgi:hypothetical protein
MDGAGNYAWNCNDDGDWAYAGTEGLTRNLEAVAFTYEGPGFACFDAKALLSPWWEGESCHNGNVAFYVGTIGRSWGLEFFKLRHTTKINCTDAHVQNVGWTNPPGTDGCVGANVSRTVGIGGRNLERVSATVL